MGSIVRSAFALSILPSPRGAALAGGSPRRSVTIAGPAASSGGDAPIRRLARNPFDRGVRRSLRAPADVAPGVAKVGATALHAASTSRRETETGLAPARAFAASEASRAAS